MIDFSLQEAHPIYRDLIVEMMEALWETFPAAPLKKVLVYPQESAKNCQDCTNRSLGDAIQPGTIRLNGYWFSQPPGFLYAASEIDDFMPEIPSLRWHGGLPQPTQVMIHEFFHVLDDGLGPGAKKFSEKLWNLATQHPFDAPTGYSLYDSDEHWAECGAMLLLRGPESNIFVKSLGNFLKAVQPTTFDEFLSEKHPRDVEGKFKKGN